MDKDTKAFFACVILLVLAVILTTYYATILHASVLEGVGLFLLQTILIVAVSFTTLLGFTK